MKIFNIREVIFPKTYVIHLDVKFLGKIYKYSVQTEHAYRSIMTQREWYNKITSFENIQNSIKEYLLK